MSDPEKQTQPSVPCETVPAAVNPSAGMPATARRGELARQFPDWDLVPPSTITRFRPSE